MMNKNSALLSIGAALLFSLFFIDLGHAFQIDKKQDARTLMAGEVKGTANAPTTQVSNMPNPCTDAAMGRTGAPCKRHSPPGSAQVSNTPPCTDAAMGRTGTPCKRHSPPVSAKKATDGSLYTSATMLR